MELWIKWFMTVMLAINALLVIAAVGKRREPITGGTAALVTVLDAAYITAIIVYWD